VLIISHDRHLIEATCDTLWIAEGGTIRELDEDLDSYQNSITSGKESKGGSKAERKANKAEAAARRAEIAPIKSAIKDVETKIARLKTEIGKVDAQLDDPKVYNGSPERMIALGKDKARLTNELDTNEEKWLALSADLEEAERV
ncbi:MAG: ABC transporter ATP-binding protein, partial [Alphaproteobacteria bacterium]|nr:ABC transporter ATP-binding protein [Alphaproteobacteria bacterium]